MEQWNKGINEVTKPRKTRAVRLSKRSILCSIIVEQWNKAPQSSDSQYHHSTHYAEPDIASRMRIKAHSE